MMGLNYYRKSSDKKVSEGGGRGTAKELRRAGALCQEVPNPGIKRE